jgi:hypothetical protein
MQTANIMVALGGDTGNTVPKYQVTAAEIAVLQAIHGADAIFDIEPTEDSDVKNRDELRRLKEVYAGPNTGRLVEALYPGAAARVFENIDELELADEQFKPTERERKPPPAKTKAQKAARKEQEAVDEAKEQGVARPQNKKAVDDGIADMPQSGLLE